MNKFIKEYLKSLGKESVDELSDIQVEEYYTKFLKMPVGTHNALKKVEEGFFTISQVHASMRKAMREDKLFGCGYVENESCNGEYTPESYGWILQP